MIRAVCVALSAAMLLAAAGVVVPSTAEAAAKKSAVGPKRVGPVRVAPRVVGPRVAPRVAPRVVGPRVAPRVVGPRVVPRVVGPRVVAPRVGPLIIRGRPITVIRGPRSVFWRGHRRTLIPLAAITAITVGAVAYRAYAYVPVEQPLCAGPTPDGCELRWQEVATPEGDLIPQCVQFCPQQP